MKPDFTKIDYTPSTHTVPAAPQGPVWTTLERIPVKPLYTPAA